MSVAKRQSREGCPALWIACWLVFLSSAPSVSQERIADPPSTVDPHQIVAGPREMLRLYQIGESQLDLFIDGEPLSDDAMATLMRLLYRAPAFPLHKVHRWEQWDFDLGRVIAEPHRFRGACMKLAGTVTHIDRLAVPERFAELFGFDHYYQVTMEIAGATATVYCRAIPAAWTTWEIDRNEPASVSAMSVKTGAGINNRPEIVAIANTFAWHPSQPSVSHGVTADHVFLAQHGMDVSQFALVEDRQPLTAHDRECFYQLLATVSKLSPTAMAGRPAAAVDVTVLLQNPETHRGQYYTLIGTARRAVRIRVDDVDIVERFGIDHYFEVEVFTDPEMTVRFVDHQGDAEDKVFHRYPVVVCMRELPSWFPEGEGIHVNVQFSGFFLKHWTYKSQYMSAGSAAGAPERLQISPLLIGTSLSRFEFRDESSRIWGPVFGGLFGLLLVGIVFYVWKTERGDQEFQRRRARRQPPPSF